jgi:cytosine/adenosine deaminase-related metal-dependent hydrolase
VSARAPPPLLIDPSSLGAQPAARAIVFRNTTVVNADAVQNDVALAVVGDKIAAIGPTDQILKGHPNADVYDGRGKALFPGLVNCHAHLTATLQRGFNEDFGFPNSAKLPVQPGSLLQGEEATLMTVVGALEAIRTGTTTFVENAGGIDRYAAALSKTGLRWVFAESIRDSENVPGPLSRKDWRKARRHAFHRSCAKKGCSASRICSARGMAR